jgi:hypothetical protein
MEENWIIHVPHYSCIFSSSLAWIIGSKLYFSIVYFTTTTKKKEVKNEHLH